MFVPEKSYLQGVDTYLFAYSIRMSVVPEGCVVDGVRYSSCQLYARHWIIKANGQVENEVAGKGVIGMVGFLFKILFLGIYSGNRNRHLKSRR